MSDKQFALINPPGMPPTAGYSHIASVGNGRTIYLSGQVPLNAEGALVGETFAAQATQAFENVRKGLAAVGCDFSDVVKLGMYVTDMSNLAELRAIRDKFIDVDRPPASTLVEVSGFFRRDILVEIEAIAVAN